MIGTKTRTEIDVWLSGSVSAGCNVVQDAFVPLIDQADPPSGFCDGAGEFDPAKRVPDTKVMVMSLLSVLFTSLSLETQKYIFNPLTSALVAGLQWLMGAVSQGIDGVCGIAPVFVSGVICSAITVVMSAVTSQVIPFLMDW